MTAPAKTSSSKGWGPEVKAVSVVWGHPTGLPLDWPADGPEPTEEQAPYRFRLIIDLADEGTGRTLVVVGANPSTANAKDPRAAVDEILSFAGSDPKAIEGARSAFWKLMERDAKPITVASAD